MKILRLFTGYYDKNGIEIYEDDLLQYMNGNTINKVRVLNDDFYFHSMVYNRAGATFKEYLSHDIDIRINKQTNGLKLFTVIKDEN